MAASVGARRGSAPRPGAPARQLLRAVLIVAIVGALLAAGLFLRGGRDGSTVPGAGPGAASSPLPLTGASSSPALGVAPYLLAGDQPAPRLDLADPDGAPFTFEATRPDLVLVFFGYTHCPDVCPATTGILGEALRAYGPGVRAVFVTVDPERDTPEWLRDYVRFLPRGFTVLIGDADATRTTADAWGVRYARVETDDPGAYTVSHTADVFLVDGAGMLRAKFPFGTESAPIVATLRHVAATTPAATPAGSAAPGATPGATPTGPPSVLGLQPQVVSSSIWSGASPIILALFGPNGRLTDPALPVSVQLLGGAGLPVGEPVSAVGVRPPGVDVTSYVATLEIPAPGAWRLEVTARAGAVPIRGTTGLLTALDASATPAVGGPAPRFHTPSLADVTDARLVTTDPVPDLRLSRRSTTDALAEGTPFVIVFDSYRFKVTAACGRALSIAKYLVDRWPAVTFIHHEPYRYSLVTETPVLEGSLSDPRLTDVAVAYGLDQAPWDARSMPWVFIVDGDGVVRARYQGVVGTDDLDVILALIAQEG